MDSMAQGGDSAAALESQLAGVARKIAFLLTRPGYDEAELAELDVRAAQLRAQIRAARPPSPSDEPSLNASRLRLGG
jgi:hypothetical protein